MPRLVSLLLFALLLSAQVTPAARLPELQAAGSSKTEATVQSNKDTSPQPVAAAHSETLADNAPQANVEAPPIQGAMAQNLPSAADQTSADRAVNAPALELAASSAAANPGPNNADPNNADPNNAAPKDPVIDNQSQIKTDKDAAAVIISGSRRPGVIEHQIVRTNRGDKPDINISYPSVGVRSIDASIRK